MIARLVVALDFPGAAHGADFGFLLRSKAADRIRRFDPLTDHMSGSVTLVDQAHEMISRLSEPPGLVVTYCGTAALGAWVAEIAGACLLAVDPYPVTMADIRRDFAELCRTVGCHPPGHADCASEADVTLWMSAIVAERDRLAADYGGDGDAYQMVDDLFARYRAWLRFLCASQTARPAAPPGAVTVVVGTHRRPLDALLAKPGKARVHLVESDGETLGSAQAQALVTAAVMEATAGIASEAAEAAPGDHDSD